MTMVDQSIMESFMKHGKEFGILFRQLSDCTGVHAYMISGEKGTGKRTLAYLMGKILLCSSDGKKPCGVCQNCLLTEKGDHPDLIVIENGNPIAAAVKKDRTTIPVEDIREMIRLCGIHSTNGNMRVVLILEADRMTAQAQNCLLKTLEEPPENICIILVTDHPESLMATVVSRCRIIRMKAWDDDYILSVLQKNGISAQRASDAVAASNGSIGKALELASDESFWNLRNEILHVFFETTSRSEVLRISNQWKERKPNAGEILSVLESFVIMMTETRFGKADANLSFLPAQWQRFSANAEKDSFIVLAEAIAEARRQLQFSTNFQAVLERIIFTFMGEGNKWLQ